MIEIKIKVMASRKILKIGLRKRTEIPITIIED